jgi:hypothetical protein
VNGDQKLSVIEFSTAIDKMKEEIGGTAMVEMGLSRGTIIKTILFLVFILLLLFTFIFLGIMGFTTGSTLGSVVNSLMPIGAGGSLAGGTGASSEDKVKTIGPSVNKAMNVLTVKNV